LKIERNVPEVVSFFKEIQFQSEKILETVRLNVQEMVGKYLSEWMSAALTHHRVRIKDPFLPCHFGTVHNKWKCQHANISPSHSEAPCLSAYRLKAYGKRNCALSNLKRTFCH
jgi:hypothetical protein